MPSWGGGGGFASRLLRELNGLVSSRGVWVWGSSPRKFLDSSAASGALQCIFGSFYPNTHTPTHLKKILFRFKLISRMVLGVGKKSEIRLKSEDSVPCRLLYEGLEPIQKPTILDSEMRVRCDPRFGESHLTLRWESRIVTFRTDPGPLFIFILYQVRARTLHESLTGSEPCDSAWDSAETLCVVSELDFTLKVD